MSRVGGAQGGPCRGQRQHLRARQRTRQGRDSHRDGALLVQVLGVSCTLTVRRAVLWGVHAQLLAAAAAAAA